MDDTLDAWVRLAGLILKQAIKESIGGRTIYQRLDARLFLLEPGVEWLTESLGLDIERIRAMVVREWTHQAF
jgi:hypothetical protein